MVRFGRWGLLGFCYGFTHVLVFQSGKGLIAWSIQFARIRIRLFWFDYPVTPILFVVEMPIFAVKNSQPSHSIA